MAANHAVTTGADMAAYVRAEPRDEVLYRTRATGPDGDQVPIVIVNISARGLMARCERDYPIGERLRVRLPVTGPVTAEIRWALGGRMGCQLDSAIPYGHYYAVIAAMVRGR